MINLALLHSFSLHLFWFWRLVIAHKGKPRMNKKHFEKHWKRIEEDDNYTAAILDADELLEDALKYARIKGGTTGERLNNSAGFIRDLSGAWSAHKLRNQIKDESESAPTAIDCQSASPI